MTKKAKKKVWDTKKIKWFKSECDKWIKRYYLEDWVITFVFSEKDFKEEETTGWIAAASTEANPTYNKATITFYPAILTSQNEPYSGEKTINNIKHELCHLLTIKLNDLAHDRYASEKQINDELESLTQKISIIT